MKFLVWNRPRVSAPYLTQQVLGLRCCTMELKTTAPINMTPSMRYMMKTVNCIKIQVIHVLVEYISYYDKILLYFFLPNNFE